MSSLTPGRTPDRDRPLRRDAERNRQLVLAAARQVLAARGLDAGFEEIARVAGVGVATVYRRFPERSDLVDALFEEEIVLVGARLEEALAVADPWTGLRDLVLWSVHRMANDRGLAQVLAAAGHGHQRIDRERARLDPLFDELVRRAQATGALRPDVTALDLLIALTLTSRIGAPGSSAARERHATLLLDGLAAHRDSPTPMPAPAPTAQDLACIAAPDDRPRPPSR